MTRRPNIYLDIDGVLLANERYAANHAPAFIRHVVTNYRVYWLTTHCHGDAGTPVRHIRHLFDSATANLLTQIHPTDWHTAKTEAIDFRRPFLWFDDDLFDDERAALLEHDALSSWIAVDLYRDPDNLGKLLEHFPAP